MSNEKLWAAALRCDALCNRVSKRIHQGIQAQADMSKLDELSALSRRCNGLFHRIYDRYEKVKVQA